MNAERIAELRRLAEAATPGEWYCDADEHPDDVSIWTGQDHDADIIANMGFLIQQTRVDQPADQANGMFIAAANPAAILSMLDEVERLRDALDDIWACANSGYTFSDLRQKIAMYTEDTALSAAD